MRFPALLGVALTGTLLLPSCDGQRQGSVTTTTVTDARVQLPVVPGRPGVAYFSVTINERADELVSVTTPIARVELHETTTSGGVTRMGPVRDLRMEKGKPLVFAPGGRHAMLLAISPTVKPGDTVPLTFTFRHSPPATAVAEVRSFGGAGDH